MASAANSTPDYTAQSLNKAMGEKNGMVAVWEPTSQTLKAVPKSEVQSFADQGYHVGFDAQAQALRHSGMAKLGAFFTAGGNAGSAGLFNLGLVASGQKGALRQEARAQSDNPGAAFAGSMAGFLGPGIAAKGINKIAGTAIEAATPYSFGGLPAGAMASAAERGGLAHLVARGTNAALHGAPAMAALGGSDAITEATVLGKPVTAQQIASSMMHDVVWNAAFNSGLGLAMKTPRGIVAGGRKVADSLEQWNLLKRGMVADLEAAQGAPKATAKTKIFEREYADGSAPVMGSDGLSPQAREQYAALPFEAGPDGKQVIDAEAASVPPTRLDRIRGRPAPQSAGQTFQLPGTVNALTAEERAAAEAGGRAIERAGVESGKPGLPDGVMASYEPAERPMKITARVEPVPEVESLSLKNKRLDAETKRAKAEEALPQRPEDIEPDIEWQGSWSKAQKLSQIRAWIKGGAEEAHPDAMATYDKIQDIENAQKELTAEHEKLKKEDDVGVVGYERKLTELRREKVLWKQNLRDMYPAKYDKATGEYTPGYEFLDRQYAIVADPAKNAPKGEARIVDKNLLKHDIAMAEHEKAVEVADKADAKLRQLEQHHAELDRRAQTIERNRIAQVEADAKNKAAAAEYKIQEKQRKAEQAATAKEQKAQAKLDAAEARKASADEKRRISAELKEAKAQAKLERDAAKAHAANERELARSRLARETQDAKAKASAERDKALADAKAERKTAKDEAAKARDKQRRLNAQYRANAAAYKKAQAQAAMPRANGEVPKSAQTERATFQSETEEGLRTDTVERRHKNGKVFEKHRVTIKSPKTPPAMKKGDYEMPFGSDMIAKVGAVGYMTGMNGLTKPVALGMTGANLAVKLLNHRTAIGKAFMKVTDGLNALGIPIIKGAARSERSRHNQTAQEPEYHVADYEHMSKAVNYLSANPEAVHSYMSTRYKTIAEDHPELFTHANLAVQNGINGLNDQLVKRPYDPTLIDTDFLPTRAQQVKAMRLWAVLGHPQLGLEMADPDVMRLLEETYPDLVAEHRDYVTNHITQHGAPQRGHFARQASMFLGANVRPIDEAAALKRLQQTAGPPPMQQHAGMGQAGASSKITTQAVNRDATDTDLARLM